MSSSRDRVLIGAVTFIGAVFAAGVVAGALVAVSMGPSDRDGYKLAASTDGRAPTESATPPGAAAEAGAAEQPADPCAGQIWPYISSACAEAKAVANASKKTRDVRVVATDRGAPSKLATATPKVEPKPDPTTAPKADTADATAAGPAASPSAPAVAEPTAEAPASEPWAPPLPVARPALPDTAVAAATPEPGRETPPDARQDVTKPVDRDDRPTAHVEARPTPVEARPTPAEVRPAPVESRPAKSVAQADVASEAKPAPETKPAVERARPTVRRPAATREAARVRTARQPPEHRRAVPVPDPDHSPSGPMLVRTYDYPDGRRVTVYQPVGQSRPLLATGR